MFTFRKAPESDAYDNAARTVPYENDEDVSIERRVHDLDAPLSDPPIAARPRTPEVTAAATHGPGGSVGAAVPAGPAGPDVIGRIDMARRYSDQAPVAAEKHPPRVEDPDAERLSIGSAIKLKGSVESCGELQVNGHLEASAQSRTLTVAKGGTFVGNATVDNADIHGRFEGELTVREKLVIRATGTVDGTVRYGRIEIESGGRISGDVQALLVNERTSDVRDEPRAPSPAAVPQASTPAWQRPAQPPEPHTVWRDRTQAAVSSRAHHIESADEDE